MALHLSSPMTLGVGRRGAAGTPYDMAMAAASYWLAGADLVDGVSSWTPRVGTAPTFAGGLTVTGGYVLGNGTSGKLTLPIGATPALNLAAGNAFTVMVDLRADTISGSRTIWSTEESAGDPLSLFAVGGVVRSWIWDGVGGSQSSTTGAPATPLNTRVVLCMTVDNQARIVSSKAGASVSNSTTTLGDITSTKAPVLLNAANTGATSWSNARIYNMAQWNRKLLDAERDAVFAAWGA